ncbi:MAG: hypothetical protein ACREKH_15380 [Candidatus Rokuibacteriota bacterium]
MILTTSAGRQVQDCSIRVLLDSGEIEPIVHIERDPDGAMFVRTALGRRHPAERIISIVER